MKKVLIGVLLAASLALTGCNPYMAAISAVAQTYSVATDDRSLTTQATDAEAEAKIKADLFSSPVQGTDSISVFCRRGVVVLTGVVPPGSQAGITAVRIARQTSGVHVVETFYVSSQQSTTQDLELGGKVKAAFIADPNLTAPQVDVRVYNGHVVLIGVVSNLDVAQEFVNDASAVPGVWSVRSFIQTESEA
jgi:osmotically-inducible protein OsmY